MAHDTAPLFQPHLSSWEENGQTFWHVRMKQAAAEYHILSESTSSKRIAARHLKYIRKEMAELWLKQEAEES